MKSVRLLRWSGPVLSSPTRPHNSFRYLRHPNTILFHQQYLYQTTSAEPQRRSLPEEDDDDSHLARFPSPPPSRAHTSARLNALHARLSLSPRLPIETLARCLVHPSADLNARFNNASLAVLGQDILGYYTSEAILCRYPRLPTEVVFSAMMAFCGPKTLAVIAREWGVEIAAAPGGEVDPGLLQSARREAGNAAVNNTGIQLKELQGQRRRTSVTASDAEQKGWQRGVGAESINEDQLANEASPPEVDHPSATVLDSEPSDAPSSQKAVRSVTVEDASASFVRALFGALYLHTGLPLTKAFYNSHILSRHLEYSSLFSFRQPTRDLARLCARENFLPPIARILAETGRQSRHPVFIVGVFSGREKLGEGSGASLDEARIRAAVNALKGWYLYSPLDVMVPSQAKRGEEFPPVMIDGGEVIV